VFSIVVIYKQQYQLCKSIYYLFVLVIKTKLRLILKELSFFNFSHEASKFSAESTDCMVPFIKGVQLRNWIRN